MAEKISELTGKRRMTISTIIQGKDGNILPERGHVLKRWQEYVRYYMVIPEVRDQTFGRSHQAFIF